MRLSACPLRDPLSRLDGWPDLLLSTRHAHRGFARLTWTALPASGIGFQPQTQMQRFYYMISFTKKQGASLYKVRILPCSAKNRQTSTVFADVTGKNRTLYNRGGHMVNC